MSAQELLVRILAQTEPLLPYMLATAIVTGAVFCALLRLSRGLWVDQPKFRWLGLFYNIGRGEGICLACAWIKFLMLLWFLAGFQKLEIAHYLLFLLPGALYALWPRQLPRMPARVLWLALEGIGLLCGNLLCRYIRDMKAGAAFYAVYVVTALFLALFGLYLFLMEIDDISSGRKADFE